MKVPTVGGINGTISVTTTIATSADSTTITDRSSCYYINRE
jgi:hypothetical protein